MDAANIDLKAFTNQFYEQLCFARLEPVLDTLRWLKLETKVWLEVTTLLIPGYNDSEEEVAQLCAWFVRNLGQDVPLHFTAFHPDFKMLDIPSTPTSTLTRARQQALNAGIHHVYTGNVYDVEGQSTACASCGCLLIERSGYTLGQWNLGTDGRCKFCGARLAGHFDPQPGRWGVHRKPLFMRS
jgi:pyruvate formate lyase activating enzyme